MGAVKYVTLAGDKAVAIVVCDEGRETAGYWRAPYRALMENLM